MLQHLYQLLISGSIDYAELQAAWIAILWGFWMLFVPGPSHQVLGFPLPMGLWGAAALGLGSLQMLALLTQHVTLRRVASLIAVGLWLFFSIVVLLQHPTWMLWPTALAFAVSSAWAYIRLGLRE